MTDVLGQFITDNTDGFTAAANFTIVVFMLVLCACSVYLLVKRDFSAESVAPYLLAGAAMETGGWAVHRAYWGAWRLARTWKLEGWDQWFVTHGYLALIPSTLVLMGLAMLLSPLWTLMRRQEAHSNSDYWVAAGLIFGVYWFILFTLYELDVKAFDRIWETKSVEVCPPTNSKYVSIRPRLLSPEEVQLSSKIPLPTRKPL